FWATSPSYIPVTRIRDSPANRPMDVTRTFTSDGTADGFALLRISCAFRPRQNRNHSVAVGRAQQCPLGGKADIFRISRNVSLMAQSGHQPFCWSPRRAVIVP